MAVPPPASPPMSEEITDEVKNQFSLLTSEGEWDEVVKLYEEKPGVWSISITNSHNTALHMAINDDREDIVQRLTGTLEKNKKRGALTIANEGGDAPLHRAASNGSVTMCERILTAANRMGQDLLSVTNIWGRTPIFVAALQNRKDAFIFLHDAASAAYSTDPDKQYQLLRSTVDGDTVLHAAIRRDHYDLAFHIIRLYPKLLDKSNEKGETPLHVLASKPSAFRSGYHLSWWQLIIYHCKYVDPLKYDPHVKGSSKPNYPLEGDPENPNFSHIKGDVPQNYVTCFGFLAMAFLNISGVIGFGQPFNRIKEARQKHEWSVQILDELMKKRAEAYMKEGNNPGKSLPGFERPFDMNIKGTKYTETQNGVIEVVNKILDQLPLSIQDTSTRNRNILMVTVEKRQPTILEALHRRLESNKRKLWDDLVKAVDTEDNNILHFAAKCDESLSRPWQIHGSGALQVQLEIKWYEYVKSFLPPHFIFLTNKEGKTPEEIFIKDHEKLVEESGEWLNRSSESCSVVAALVAGVSFATSSTLPGGNNDNGKPNLERQPPFGLFVIAALFALCFSVTALIMFLSIHISRKQPLDFMRKIPLKLFLSLSSLFLSIISMVVSFYAAHSFVVDPKFKKAVLPLYAATALPVFLTIADFPLYVSILEIIVRRVRRPYDYAHL